MPQSDRRISLWVCLVAENCLAEAYLRHVLCEHPELHAISLKQYLRLSPLQRTKTVFIVDLCGLDVPLYECLGELRARCSNAKFLLLGNEKSTDEIVRLLIMGVQGYIPHPGVPRALFRAISSLAANQWWVPHEAFQQFLGEAASALRDDGRLRSTVTPREEQILELVRRRLSNREIAARLQIQVSTVKFHLSNILSKMYVSSRRELMETPSGQVWRTLSS
jgi:NarL family two-component system response regulator LiaR